MLIEQGVIALSEESSSGSRSFARLSPGDLFGELGTVSDGKVAHTLSSVVLFRFSSRDLTALMERNPAFKEEIMGSLSQAKVSDIDPLDGGAALEGEKHSFSERIRHLIEVVV
jgi:CRP-like cAMP-binding protein